MIDGALCKSRCWSINAATRGILAELVTLIITRSWQPLMRPVGTSLCKAERVRSHELTTGRTFGIAFDHHDDFFDTLTAFCVAKDVRQGYIPMFIPEPALYDVPLLRFSS